MQEEKIYNEIEHIIKNQEINKRKRFIEENNETLLNYWNIGKLIVEAQGGEARAKYGNELIKEWSIKLTALYGKGYRNSNLKYMRQFYLLYQISQPVVGQLSWSHYLYLLPIKDNNKRNYYINLCIERNLSKRELINEIKSNSYERLIDKPERIDIVGTTNNYSITSKMKNPIIIELKENEKIVNESDLEIKLLAKLSYFFNQLGDGFALIDNQYKINYQNKNYYIDILLFNIELNCYVVVELKLRELRKEDKAQIEFYMEIIDKVKKKPFHNKTIGIIISKYQNKYIASFVSSENVIPLMYQIKNT